MKKVIIISSIVILFITAAIISYMYFSSFQKVSVTLNKDVDSVTLYKTGEEKDHDHQTVEGSELEKLVDNQTISLQKGDYYLIATGTNMTQEPIYFTVENRPLAVDVDPDYTDTFLTSQLPIELPAISSALTNKYPLTNSDYTLTKDKLYKKGEWYGALIIKKDSDPQDQPDYYRVILHKEAGSWNVIDMPRLIFTVPDFKGVPSDVLRDVNKLIT